MDVPDTALVKKLVKDALLKPRYRNEDPAAATEAVLQDHGLASRLSNMLYASRRASEEPQTVAMARALRGAGRTAATGAGPAAPTTISTRAGDVAELDIMRALQARWQSHVEAAVRRLCAESGGPLMRTTAAAVVPAPKSSRQRGLYEPSEMLQLVADAEAPRPTRTHIVQPPLPLPQRSKPPAEADALPTQHDNAMSSHTGLRGWGLVPFELATPSLGELADGFGELRPSVRQSGVDDELRGWSGEERQVLPIRLLEVPAHHPSTAAPTPPPGISRVACACSGWRRAYSQTATCRSFCSSCVAARRPARAAHCGARRSGWRSTRLPSRTMGGSSPRSSEWRS